MPVRRVRRRLLRPIVQFIQTEASSGLLLMGAAVLALVWANSPWAASYFALWKVEVPIGPIQMTAHHWINDGMMALFFLLVGLEIKREILLGELSSVRKATLPIAAAIGGMVAPAVGYLIFNWGGEGARGWGIPMATDIAFALGVLALLGPRVPLSLKVFLAALAIVDDLGAVLVIALFYTSNLHLASLLGGVVVCALLFLMNGLRVRNLTPYILLGIVLWVLFLKSGVHATIAGVLLAATIPARVRINGREYVDRCRRALDGFEAENEGQDHVLVSEARQTLIQDIEHASEEAQMPLERVEHTLHPWVTYGIVPLFAFANAGVPLAEGLRGAAGSPIGLGVVVGLLVGKPLGIIGASWIAVKMKLAELPTGVGWRHVFGVGLLGGIGFTMSLFIGELALPQPDSLVIAKSAILVGSLVAGIAGYLVLRKVGRVRRDSVSAEELVAHSPNGQKPHG